MHGKILGAGPTTGTKEVDTRGPIQRLNSVSGAARDGGVPDLRGQSEQSPEEQEQGTTRPRPLTG